MGAKSRSSIVRLTWKSHELTEEVAMVHEQAGPSLVRGYLAAQRLPVAVMTLLLLASIGLALAEPQLVSRFLASAQQGAAQRTLVLIAVAFLLVATTQQTAKALATYWSRKVGWTATNLLRGDLTAHVLSLDLDFHESHPPGELIERIDGDVSEINEFFSSFVVVLVGNAILLLGILTALAAVDIRVGLAFAGLIVVFVLGLVGIRNIGARQWQADREQNAQFYGYVGEALRASEDLRSAGAESYAMAGLRDRLRRWLPVNLRATAWACSVWMGTIGLFTGTTLLAYSIGGSLFRGGELTVTEVYLIVAYGLMLLIPVEAIRSQLQYLQQAVASVQRVRELFAIHTRLADGTQKIPGGPLSIEFDRVSFAYRSGADQSGPGQGDAPKRPSVLLDVSFVVRAGRVLGLVGRTGAGKTTIAHLLFRMFDPVSGHIRIGGRDLTQARLASLRSRIGLVTQDIHLFNASLRDNLTFFDAGHRDEHLVEVVETLGLGDWLAGLPEGLDTPISTGSLSGGEAQLIALARVFLSDPGLVILDEPSSRLDPSTDQLVQRALAALLEGRTAIVIAHRLQTLQRVDDVMVLDEGRMLEFGVATDLLDDPDSRYAALHRAGKVLR
jgi:ATP-binding cassette subfamily B protein